MARADKATSRPSLANILDRLSSKGLEEKVLLSAIGSSGWTALKPLFEINPEEADILESYHSSTQPSKQNTSNLHDDEQPMAEDNASMQTYQDIVHTGSNRQEEHPVAQSKQSIEVRRSHKILCSLRKGDKIVVSTTNVLHDAVPTLNMETVESIQKGVVTLTSGRSYSKKDQFLFYTTYLPQNKSTHQQSETYVQFWTQIDLIEDSVQIPVVFDVDSTSEVEEQKEQKKILCCIKGKGNHYYVPLARFKRAEMGDTGSCTYCINRAPYICIICSVLDAPQTHKICRMKKCRNTHENGILMERKILRQTAKEQDKVDAATKGEEAKIDGSNKMDAEGLVAVKECEESGEDSEEDSDNESKFDDREEEDKIFRTWTTFWELDTEETNDIVNLFKVSFYFC